MELDWYCTGAVGMKQQSYRGFYGFQNASSEHAGKAKKATTWHLMPHNKHLGKQDCNRQFCNHKYLKLANTGRSQFTLQICLFNASIFNIIFCQFIYCYSSAFLFIFLSVVLICIHLFLLLFVRSVCFIIQCLIIQCYFLFWYWNCIPGISISHNINHPVSQ